MRNLKEALNHRLLLKEIQKIDRNLTEELG